MDKPYRINAYVTDPETKAAMDYLDANPTNGESKTALYKRLVREESGRVQRRKAKGPA